MRLLVFDNYDSFTYNIVHALRHLGAMPDIFRNDMISLEDIGRYDSIVLSPGPGVPSDAGLLMPLLDEYARSGRKILGVCLGHQAIGQAFGAGLTNLSQVYHGVQTNIEQTVDDESLFAGLEREFPVGRYHSWVVSNDNFPTGELEVTARDSQGQIMAMRHRKHPVRGVQFHPESILTPAGLTIIENWLKS